MSILGGNNPIGVIFAANAPDTTLRTANFNLEFGKGADLEHAGPFCGYEGEAMCGEDGFEFFLVIALVAAECNRELERKTDGHKYADSNIQSDTIHLITSPSAALNYSGSVGMVIRIKSATASGMRYIHR